MLGSSEPILELWHCLQGSCAFIQLISRVHWYKKKLSNKKIYWEQEENPQLLHFLLPRAPEFYSSFFKTEKSPGSLGDLNLGPLVLSFDAAWSTTSPQIIHRKLPG